jgi:hypothetical protein
MKTHKFKVFISTAHIDPQDEQDNTGDIDYAKAIYEESSKLLPEQVCRISGLFKEQEIYAHIEERADIEPVLHVMINPPRTGMAFTSEGLRAFKEKNKAKIIITAIEFAKLINNKDSTINIANGLKILSVADQIIFLDSNDKDVAYVFADQSLKSKINQASIVPVLPTIEQLLTVPIQNREKNIISFGMIRVGKGLGLVILLATMLKQKNITDQKVLVVGTVQDNPGGAKELKRLMMTLYPTKLSEIKSQTTTTELKKLLCNYNNDPTIIPDLPMEIHVDVPKDQLLPLFNRCTYAFLPAYRGATFRNSSITSCLAQRFIIYSHIDPITPIELLPEGAYTNALMLFNGFNGDNGQIYVDWVLQNILAREQNPALNIECIEAIEKLLSEKLSRDVIGKQHVDLYNSDSSACVVIANGIQPKHRFFGLWYAAFQAKRAYKQFKQVHDIDISKQAKKNWSELIKRLGKLEPEEIRFFDSLMDSDWYLTHATDALSAIQQTGYKLLSLKERIRKDPKMAANRNTNPFEGNDDNVFFAFGPGKVSSPEFLKSAEHIIEVDVNKGFAEKAASLHGLWSSGHIFAFGTEQDGTPINFYGTTFSVRYRKIDPTSQNVAKNFKKIFRFEYKDRTVKEQQIKVEDEIFDDKHLKQALILMTIEKVRLLGPEAWKKIIQEKTSLEDQQQIVKDLFHVGVFEVHKPAVFALKQPFVVVNQLNKPENTTTILHSSEQLIKTIETNDQNVAQQQLDSGVSIDEYSYSNQYFDRNALTAALFSGHTNMVHWCLNKGVKIFKPNEYFICQKNGQDFLRSSITEVIALGSKDASIWIGPTAIQNSSLFRQYLDLLLYHGTVVPNNSHSRTCAIITQQDIIQAIQIFKLSEDDLCYLVERATSIHPKNLPVVVAVKTGYVRLVKQMLEIGANVNQQHDKSKLFEMRNLPDPLHGFTPLVQAILLENLEMVQLLLEYKADVNLAYTSKDLSSRIIDLEGKAPLEIAKTKNNETSKKIIQLLEKHGAMAEQKTSWKYLPSSQLTPKFLSIDVIFVTQNEAGEPFVILSTNTRKIPSFMQADVGTVINFKQLFEDFFVTFGVDNLNFGSLSEFSFSTNSTNSTKDETFYGHQLYYVKLPSLVLNIISEDSEECFIVKLKELSRLTSLPSISPYVKSVLIALQPDSTDDSYKLDESKLEDIKATWTIEKQKLLRLKQAIENKDPDELNACLSEQQDSDLDDICFHGNFPTEVKRTPEAKVRAIDLAIYYENIDCIYILLKNIIEHKTTGIKMYTEDYYRYEGYLSKCIELSCKQNNTKLLDFFNTNDKCKTLFKEYILKNTYVINYTIPSWIKENSSTDVENWFLQYKKEQQQSSNTSSSPKHTPQF